MEQILSGTVRLQQVYVPLLFLIRHSLELVLKANVADAEKYLPGINDPRLKREHKLTQVLRHFSTFLDSLDLRKMPRPLRKKLARFRRMYSDLNTTLHQLDIHSRVFRFPTDKEGNVQAISTSRINMQKIIELLYYTDSFLTFTDLVLLDLGIIGPKQKTKSVRLADRLLIGADRHQGRKGRNNKFFAC
ncbi:hypothetical protein MKQ70_32295 [Chitinophaga sedimenti]|uniref:hypothetical protein n=1 Tax=Chitinophaga sedimenti TaxID=2033606 RepID=UPI002005646E|nr:hypothetical protein [Chitinophaga sedimenti]MCK7559398.1 hypothetical protein [Chitinophaga sedimenti]